MIYLLLSSVPPASACDAPRHGLYAEEPLGWSADSRYFAFTGEQVSDDAATKVVAVIDAREDSLQTLTRSAFDAWRASHPLVEPDSDARCGSATLFARGEDLSGFSSGQTTLSGGVFDFQATMGDDKIATLGVTWREQTWVHAELSPEVLYWGHARLKVRPTWSPDCRFVAWLLVSHEPGGPGVGPWSPGQPVLVRPAGPTVHIMAHRSAPQTIDPIYEGLREAGFAPHVGPRALKDRDETVIYTSGAVGGLAEELAAAIPGGATIEPLTWYTPADVIVAAGLSAAP